MSKDRFLAQYGSDKHVSDLIDNDNGCYTGFYDSSIAKNHSLSLEHSKKLVDRHYHDAMTATEHFKRAKSKNVLSDLSERNRHKEIIDKLSTHPDFGVSVGVIKNKNASPEHLQKFHDKHEIAVNRSNDATHTLLNHPNVTEKILDSLSHHFNDYIKNHAKERLAKGDYK